MITFCLENNPVKPVSSSINCDYFMVKVGIEACALTHSVRRRAVSGVQALAGSVLAGL